MQIMENKNAPVVDNLLKNKPTNEYVTKRRMTNENKVEISISSLLALIHCGSPLRVRQTTTTVSVLCCVESVLVRYFFIPCSSPDFFQMRNKPMLDEAIRNAIRSVKN